ncbi:MAG TPA: adenylate kinase [Actinomycetota bacterium]|nr:adenylate kinase [Actinomycetota bacterium]
MRLVILGPPGAGKGTQTSRLASDLGIAHIATGDIFRAMRSSTDTQQSPLADRLRSYMDRGELVPDELTNEIVAHRLAEPDAEPGFLLDGYPRTTEQAKVLDAELEAQGRPIDKAVKLMITGPEIIARLAGRLVCPVDGATYHLRSNPPRVPGLCDLDGTPLVQRPDDTEEAVLRRLEVYGKQTKPLYDWYAARGILDEVDAIGTPDEVYERLAKVVGLHRNGVGGAT